MKRALALILVGVMLIAMLASCGQVEIDPTVTLDPTDAPTDAPTDTKKPDEDLGGTPTDKPTDKPEENKRPAAPDVSAPFKPVLRFAVTSDIHVTTADGRQAKRTADMITQMNNYAANGADGYNKLDAILIAGDLTDNGKASEYNVVSDIFTNNVKSGTKLVLAMGNHDWNTLKGESRDKFEMIFGNGATMMDSVIGGYHFITIYADSNNGWEYTQELSSQADKLIKAAIADTGEDKPVFVIQHIGNVDTAVGTCSPSDAKANTASKILANMQSKYDNLVVFSGHTHFPANDECSIYQDKFTSINTGTLNYAMRSMLNNSWVDMPDRHNIAQSFLVEIDADSRMRVRCWDVLQGKFVGETWLVEPWDKEDFYYTPDRFTKDDIFFADDAKVTLGMNTAGLATISFPPVPTESLSGRVYKITLKDAGGTVKQTLYKGVEYFNESKELISVGLSGLAVGKEYTVEVCAVNSLYTAEISSRGTLTSKPITLTFTASGSTPDGAADLVDLRIDASTGKITNAALPMLTPTVIGAPTVTTDATIGKGVMVFDRSTENVVKIADYSAVASTLADSMTFEAYFKIDEKPTGRYDSVVSAQQGGGFGIDVYADNVNNGQIMFHFHNGTKYVSLGTQYVIGQYYHLTAVYDGSTYKLYINGELKGTADVGPMLSLPVNSAKNIYFGGDTNESGGCQEAAKCTVAGFRLYSYALNAVQVGEAYSSMTGK